MTLEKQGSHKNPEFCRGEFSGIRAAKLDSHFIHLYVLLILRKLQVGVIGRWSELVARQHKEDESGQLHEKLKRMGKGEDDWKRQQK